MVLDGSSALLVMQFIARVGPSALGKKGSKKHRTRQMLFQKGVGEVKQRLKPCGCLPVSLPFGAICRDVFEALAGTVLYRTKNNFCPQFKFKFNLARGRGMRRTHTTIRACMSEY
jgi:hypothetical protein